jgi:hypothetical protein
MLLVLTSACANYKYLQPGVPDDRCVEKIRYKGISSSWYDASIDVVGRHISGLMLVKALPDSSIRVVFTSEMGLKFFDFEFKDQQVFNVKYVVPQLNKKVVIKTLRQDLSLVLGLPFRDELQLWTKGAEYHYGVREKSSVKYFVTDSVCTPPVRLGQASGEKEILTVDLRGTVPGNIDEVSIRHLTFDMVINLKKIEKDVDE